MKNFFQSKIFKRSLYSLGILICALVIFQAGMFIGYRRAAFSYRWGENYYRTFGGERHRGSLKGLYEEEFPNAHGAIGTIIKIDLPTLVLEGEDKIEKIVLLSDDTMIRHLKDTLTPQDLKIDDTIVVIGSPDDKGEIKAKFIRLMPTIPVAGSSTTTPAGTTATSTHSQ